MTKTSKNQQTSGDAWDSLLLRVAPARVVILFAFHIAVFAACYCLAWLIRFDFAIRPDYVDTFRHALVPIVGVQLLIGLGFGFYSGWWRYVGIVDVIRLVAGLTTALVILTVGWYVGAVFGIAPTVTRTPRGILLTDWAFSLLTLFGARLVIRVGRDRFRGVPSAEEHKRVLIVGAGDAGETLAREIQHRPPLGMKVVGFVDDQRAKWRSEIRSIPVFGPISNVRSIADITDADEVLIAIPSASGKRMREIVRHLAAANLKFNTIPGIDQLVSGKIQVTQIRPVNAEDLLRRKRIDLPHDTIRAPFKGRRVLITGGGGTIGSELASQVASLDPALLVVAERSEYALYEVTKRLDREAPFLRERIVPVLIDIQNCALMEGLLQERKPEVVLHAAAHKHVPLGEANPAEYIRNNVLATRQLAGVCVREGVDRFVFISTDKAINPTSVMGASKRAAEIALIDTVSGSNTKLTIVRFGNVIGSSGSVIPLFLEQIAAGGPVTVTHPEVTRYFLRTSEAVSLVLQAAAVGDQGHVFTLDMGQPVKIAELARDLIRLSNHTESEIPIVFTGLRPGEKLFEEVRLHGESIKPTAHPQIVVTEPPQPSSAAVQRWLTAAPELLTRSPNDIRVWLRELVDEYASPDAIAETSVSAREPQLRLATDSGW